MRKKTSIFMASVEHEQESTLTEHENQHSVIVKFFDRREDGVWYTMLDDHRIAKWLVNSVISKISSRQAPEASLG